MLLVNNVLAIRQADVSKALDHYHEVITKLQERQVSSAQADLELRARFLVPRLQESISDRRTYLPPTCRA